MARGFIVFLQPARSSKHSRLPGADWDAARSIPLKDLAPILAVPGVTFYSLQHDVPAHDQSILETQPSMCSDLKFGNFLDTASVVSELDLIITVDSAVAHLAGALGKPVWMLVQHSPDWRWLLERTDTPWYPAMRLFRQVERGLWKYPIAGVVQALYKMAESWRSTTRVGLPVYKAGAPLANNQVAPVRI